MVRGIGSPKPAKVLGKGPLLVVQQVDQAVQQSHICRRPRSVSFGLPRCQCRVCEFLFVQVSCFYGFPCDDLDLPGSYESSGQYVVVYFCICFHQFLDEGSLIAIRAVINQITGNGSSGTLSIDARRDWVGLSHLGFKLLTFPSMDIWGWT